MTELTHSQIEGLMFFVDPDTRNTIGVAKADLQNVAGHFVAFGPRVTVDAALSNLFTAAPTLYQTLTEQYKAIQGLIELIERLPKTPELDKLLSSFIEMQNGMLLAQRVAQVGIEEVAKTLDTSSKSS